MNSSRLEKLGKNKGILTVLIIFFVLIIINSLVLLYLFRAAPQEATQSDRPAAPATETVSGTDASTGGDSAQDSGAGGEGEDSAQTEQTDTGASNPAASESDSDTASTEAASQEAGQAAEAEAQTDGEAAVAGGEASNSFSPPDEAENGSDDSIAASVPPSLDALEVAQVETGQPVTFSGTGEPGRTVIIQANDNTLEETPVNDDGTWNVTASFAEPSEYTIQAAAPDTGEASSPQTLAVVEPVVEIEAPTIDVGSIGDVVSGNEFSLSGTGQPGSIVAIVVKGKVVDEVTVGDDGKWSYNLTLDTPGDYEIALNAVDADVQVGEVALEEFA